MKDAFLRLEDDGYLQVANPFHLGACQFVGMPLLQHGCDNVFNWWNYNVRSPLPHRTAADPAWPTAIERFSPCLAIPSSTVLLSLPSQHRVLSRTGSILGRPIDLKQKNPPARV